MALKVYDRNEEAILKSGNKKDFNNFYYFRAGKTVMRILGPYSNKGVWFKPFLSYYFQLGDQATTLISPRDSGGVDPIYEHGAKLYKSGDEQLVEQAKQFRPRRRFLVNAVILSDPAGKSIKDGIQVVELPAKVKEELVNYDTNVDEGYGDITNLHTGRNITIEKTGEKLMTRYSVRPHVQFSDLLELAKENGVDLNSWTLPNLDEEAAPASLEELQEVLNRIVGTVEAQTNSGTTTLPPFVNTTGNLNGNNVNLQGAGTSVNNNPVPIPNMPPPPPSAE